MTNNDRLVPLLVARDALSALAFYAQAFGARPVLRHDNPITGTLSHADLAIVDARFSLTEEARDWNSDAPVSLGGSPVVLQLLVDDADESFARAVGAGAEIVFPPVDFRGERMARVRDPFGHLWILRQRLQPAAHSPSRAEASSSSATELVRQLRGREIRSVELTRLLQARIESDATNAVVVRDFERALAAAQAADDALTRGEVLGPLHGLPITLKESFDVAGLATTWGNPSFSASIAPDDSAVARRLRQAGAHVLGKTNVAKMLADFQTDNPVYGLTRNPFDGTRGVGGSSGGAAAALAAGLTTLDVGSDLGGSIRNPAHYCGVFGHKPTVGLVSMRGHALPGLPPPPELAVVGPLARSAEDLALALRVLSERPLAPPRATSLRAFRVAMWPDDPVAPVDAEVAARVQAAGEKVAAAGGTVSDHARPALDFAHARATFAALVRAFMTGAEPDPAVLDDQAEIRRAWAAFFEEWDVLACPVMPSTARPHDDPPPLAQVTWSSLATLAHLPATAFPMGLATDSRLPIGIQAIGAEGADLTTIAFSALVAQAIR